MKLSLVQLSPLLTFLVSAAPASNPRAYLCAQAVTPVNETSERIIEFQQQTCTNISPPFLSFEAGLDVPCPANTEAVVLVFPNEGCADVPINAGNLPANLSPGQCLDAVGADTDPPTVGG